MNNQNYFGLQNLKNVYDDEVLRRSTVLNGHDCVANEDILITGTSTTITETNKTRRILLKHVLLR